MKASIIRKFYLTFVNLYGVIFFNDAYEIMKKFYPDLKKNELLKDLKERNEKATRRYVVLRTKDRKNPYIICDEFLFDEDIDEILYQQHDKPFFVCDDVDEYFKYADSIGYNPGFEAMADFAYRKMKNNTDKKEAKVLSELFTAMICERIHCDFSDPMKTFNELIQKIIDALQLENEKEIGEMLQLYMNLQANTKMITNRGYSPLELRKVMPMEDPENLVLQIGENMRNSMMDDDVDIDAIIEDLKRDKDFPEKMRDDLIRQFEEMKILKSNKAKA
ncbi:MAG: hypothetical protein IJH00_04655 [Erysipelotrichaceae bacterium]|nr:hypothetical protein [Erysipelotrichaceae bacterium]